MRKTKGVADMNVWIVKHVYGDDNIQLEAFASKKGADGFARMIFKGYSKEYGRKIASGHKLMEVTEGECDVEIMPLKVQS